MLTKRGPLGASYPAAVVLVLTALTPYLVLTTSFGPLQQLIAKDTGLSMRALGLTSGMANAAYAVGAVVAVQFAARARPRRMLLIYSVLFLLACVATAWAPNAGFFVAGHVLQGLGTGLLLIGAVPPLVLGWPVKKLSTTAVIMNLGIFGAVAVGPVVGGVSAGTGTWHPFFWIVTGVAAISLLFCVLTYVDTDPQDPSAPIDLTSLALAAGGCGSTFFAISELMGRRATSLIVLGPLLAGLAMLVALLVHQYSVRDPLIPIKQLNHTLPVAAIIMAMAAGAASVGMVELTQQALTLKGVSPTHAGMLFWPEIGMALLASAIFGRLFKTRWIPALAAGGLAVLAGGGAILVGAGTGGDAVTIVGVGMVGFGVGSSVAPALFLAAFSLPSNQLPRIFAMIELLRGVAAFLIGPVLVQIAMNTGATPQAGLKTAAWIAMGIAVAGLAVTVLVYLLGRPRPHRPELQPWLDGEQAALQSPPLLAVVRGLPSDGEGTNAGHRAPQAALSPSTNGDRAPVTA